MTIQTENKNGSGTIDKAISLLPTVVATQEPMETQQTARHMLQVTAPSTLPEGYKLDVLVDGNSLTVTVPTGGVKEGEVMSVPYPDGWSSPTIRSAPIGKWKNGLCDCFALGLCHPLLWSSLCCPLIAIGQVLTRLRLTWIGDEGTMASTKNTFRTLMWITVGYYTIRWSILYALQAYAASGDNVNVYYGLSYSYDIVRVIFGVFVIILVAKARKKVRARYIIPEESCRGCEDCCCSFWCTCCTLSQISRHTADYETYPAMCCSETGLVSNAPAIAYASRGNTSETLLASGDGVV